MLRLLKSMPRPVTALRSCSKGFKPFMSTLTLNTSPLRNAKEPRRNKKSATAMSAKPISKPISSWPSKLSVTGWAEVPTFKPTVVTPVMGSVLRMPE